MRVDGGNEEIKMVSANVDNTFKAASTSAAGFDNGDIFVRIAGSADAVSIASVSGRPPVLGQYVNRAGMDETVNVARLP